MDDDSEEDDDFGIELPDELQSTLYSVNLTADKLAAGNTLRDMHLPAGSLVMMIKRGSRYIVPTGSVKLKCGDTLLIIQEEE